MVQGLSKDYVIDRTRQLVRSVSFTIAMKITIKTTQQKIFQVSTRLLSWLIYLFRSRSTSIPTKPSPISRQRLRRHRATWLPPRRSSSRVRSAFIDNDAHFTHDSRKNSFQRPNGGIVWHKRKGFSCSDGLESMRAYFVLARISMHMYLAPAFCTSSLIRAHSPSDLQSGSASNSRTLSCFWVRSTSASWSFY